MNFLLPSPPCTARRCARCAFSRFSSSIARNPLYFARGSADTRGMSRSNHRAHIIRMARHIMSTNLDTIAALAAQGKARECLVSLDECAKVAQTLADSGDVMSKNLLARYEEALETIHNALSVLDKVDPQVVDAEFVEEITDEDLNELWDDGFYAGYAAAESAEEQHGVS